MISGLVLAQPETEDEYDDEDDLPDLRKAEFGAVSVFASTPERRSALRLRLWITAALLAILSLGGLENWYGLTDSGDVFGSDAVQYLDAARALERGDWHSALNPLWSQGYPALIALVRPLFQAGMQGDWNTVRTVNLMVFCFSLAAFGYLLCGLGELRRNPLFLGAGAAIFLSTQVCLDQVSRVGPDQLVSACFFLACGLLLRLAKAHRGRVCLAYAAALGLVLGLGFLAKAVFLPLGCMVLAVALAARLRHGSPMRSVLAAALIFAAIVLGYGAALSRSVGYRTLGESGSLNYAWHVNRLTKWVHWEGGVESADKAWPKPWLARFAHWQTDPPQFGAPLHPSVMAGQRPTVYLFQGSVRATYLPYYDPAFWYMGYHHLFHWRYQVVALGKNTADLLQVLLRMPMFYAICLCWFLLRRSRAPALIWPVAACAALGVAIYLPVHLEGRYLSAFFAVLAVSVLARMPSAPLATRRAVCALTLAGCAGTLVLTQHTVWARAASGWTPRSNVEWRTGTAVTQAGLAPGTEIGMISWTANLHCDWAYLAQLRITGEIAGGPDEAAFWALSPAEQTQVLSRFRQAGAKAALTWDKPRGAAPGWQPVRDTPMWVYRF